MLKGNKNCIEQKEMTYNWQKNLINWLVKKYFWTKIELVFSEK